jgi:segregation and condensation protein A
LAEEQSIGQTRSLSEDGSGFIGPQSAGLPPLQLSLPGFEGPIELLLRVTERDELDITTVSLVAVTAQYLQHFRAQPWADAVALGDFVATAARLLLLKSRSLLPGPPKSPAAEGEDADSELDLLAALQDYRRFRHVATSFDAISFAGAHTYPRVVPNQPVGEPKLKSVPVEQLILLLQQALTRFQEPESVVVLPAQSLSVDEKVADLRDRLRRAGVVGFLTLVEGCRSRLEVVVTFIAILHLIRDAEIEASQLEPFGEITLARAATD